MANVSLMKALSQTNGFFAYRIPTYKDQHMIGIKAFLTVLLVMPLGHACTVIALKLPQNGQYIVILGCILAAAVLMYITKFLKSAAWGTFAGLIAGTLLWAGLVEIWVKLGARAINASEQKVMELTLAIIIPLVLYLLFNEHIRCTLFIALRTGLHTLKEPQHDIPIDNWGPRIAFKMFTLIWIGHVALFFAYDPDVFGAQSLYCKIFFVACLLGGTWLFYRLTRAEEMGFAFRYAIPTVIVLWSCIETLAKWKILSEPWITLNPAFLTLVVLVFFGALLLIFRAERLKKRMLR